MIDGVARVASASTALDDPARGCESSREVPESKPLRLNKPGSGMSTSAGRVGLVEASTLTWVLPPVGGFTGMFFILEKVALTVVPGTEAFGILPV